MRRDYPTGWFLDRSKLIVSGFVFLAYLLFSAESLLAEKLSRGTLLPGTPAATDYFIKDSGQSGPVVMITGGVHGNEPAGAAAAAAIRSWSIACGRLIVLPRANVVALDSNQRTTPGESEAVGNLNRDFPRAGKEELPRGELAVAIWKLVQEEKPDWLIDLHEGYDFKQVNAKSVGSSIIVFPTDDGQAAAQRMLQAVNATITNAALKFVKLSPPVDGSLARAAGSHRAMNAMILETTTKEQPLEKRVAQHHTMLRELFAYLKLADRSAPASPAKIESRIRVALFDAEGSFGQGVPRITAQLNARTNVALTLVKPEEIQSGRLTNYDVVIFSGGSGSKQAEAIGEKGRAEVKKFVEQGGGYIGICAGAYLACDGFSWGAKVLNARTVSPKWKRGRGAVKLELTDKGREIFGASGINYDIVYANGPILTNASSRVLPVFEPLAYFRGELAENGTPQGVMVNSPAMVAATCGKGRVLCSSPHPEQTAGMEGFVFEAVRWVAAGRSQ